MSLTVAYSTRKRDQNFIDLIKATCGIKNVEVLTYVNDNAKSLTEVYQQALKDSSNNIVLFCHDDIEFDTVNWGRKLLNHFKRNPDYGIIGAAGTRYLSESGRWWDDFSKMHGQVYHKHNGNKWLSKYSSSIGNKLQDVILVDGLFFAIQKNVIKKDFDVSVKGFHFYEVTFCVNNFLEGVKIGVFTDIKITHKSIGETNQEWEDNRKLFSENYKDSLPLNVKRTLHKGEKLKVLITCINFNDYTGSELYVFELAKGLVENGCEVSIVSNIGGNISNMAKSYGIKLYDFNSPPGFKLGDGQWTVSNERGQLVPSKKGMMYKIKDVKFDVIHVNHAQITQKIVDLYNPTTAVSTIHSEVIDLEKPIPHPKVKKYIAIRPEIKKHINQKYDISKKDIEVVYNPIDGKKFTPSKTTQKNKKPIVLFVGTIDYLRKNTIFDLIDTTAEEDKELWIVGKKRDNYLDYIDSPHVKYFESTWNVERYVRQCDETASILLGRTTIEGWLCGKPGIIYDVDSTGYILGKKTKNPPLDVDKFKNVNIAKQIKEIYLDVI